mmetsp:Transcript_12148/g.22752  ORF Transcript_12148/g.22752 Transcript_12148/m.22752 type:complete len:355 (-) Transcript_12148:104-1168(-)
MSTYKMKDYVLSILGIGVGLACFKVMGTVSSPFMDPIVAKCTQGEYQNHLERIKTNDLLPYEPILGGGFVCLITQFLGALKESYPAGLLTWGAVVLCSFPISLFLGVEGGHSGVRGPLRYPATVGLLAQFLGIGVITPAVTVPSFIFGRTSSTKFGSFHSDRPKHAFYISIFVTLFSLGNFILDKGSTAWRLNAGILGGPVLALLPAYYSFSPCPPSSVHDEHSVSSAKMDIYDKNRAILEYRKYLKYAGALSLIGWMYLLFLSYSTYGTELSSIWDALWSNAHPSVKFMTLDTTGFYLGMVLCLGAENVIDMIKCMALAPLVGPSAISFVLLQKPNLQAILSHDDVVASKKND